VIRIDCNCIDRSKRFVAPVFLPSNAIYSSECHRVVLVCLSENERIGGLGAISIGLDRCASLILEDSERTLLCIIAQDCSLKGKRAMGSRFSV
jgi:hypothetical protein